MLRFVYLTLVDKTVVQTTELHSAATGSEARWHSCEGIMSDLVIIGFCYNTFSVCAKTRGV